MLQNLMEDKQLDFNQPLLSVRRFSSTPGTVQLDEKKTADKLKPKLPPLPFYKSELKSGPIRNAGTVPFVWEKTPGKPKDERKSHPQFPEQPPIAPRLPPGWVSNPQLDVAAVKGSPGSLISAQSQTGSVVLLSFKEILELDKIEDDTNATKEDKSISASSEDDDEAYLDALDTLSRSESFSMTYSVSGVSGLDGPNIKPCGTFSTDPQTRDFMMGRFLPAAKAMASETPQYAPKKQLGVREQPRQVITVMNGDMRRRPPNQYQANFLPPYAQELRTVESDNESDIYEGPDITSAKLCGLFPRFCMKNSFSLVNPVMGLKMQSQLPAFSVRRGWANSANSSTASSCNEAKIEHTKDAICGQTSVRKQTTEFDAQKSRRNFREILVNENAEREVGSGIPVVEKTLYVDSIHTVKSSSSNSISSDAKSFPDYKGNDAKIPEKYSNTEDALSLESSLHDIKHLSIVSENTALRHESSESVGSCSLSSSCRSTQENLMDAKDGSRRDGDLIQDFQELVVSEDANEPSFEDDKKTISKSQQPFGADNQEMPSSALTCSNLVERYKIDFVTPKTVKLGTEERTNKCIQSSTTKAASTELIGLETQWLAKLGGEEKSHESFLPTLALPSPKSPSESWLKRALPAASSRNSRSSLAARIGTNTQTASPLDPKWETIVKTSNLQQGHLRFSEVRLAPIPEA